MTAIMLELERDMFEKLAMVSSEEKTTPKQIEIMRRAAHIFATTMDRSIIKESIVEFMKEPQKPETRWEN